MEINEIDCIQCNLNDTSVCLRWHNVFDTIIMNPPFGTKKNAGQDMRFLENALKITNNVVYSLHKSSTRYYNLKTVKIIEIVMFYFFFIFRDFIRKKCQTLGVNAEVIAELRYNIDASYKFHKKSSSDIEVDCWRICKVNNVIN